MHDLARRSLLFAKGGQALVQHLPQKGFIFSHERTNHVIHCNRYRIRVTVADYQRNTSVSSMCNNRMVISPQSATVTMCRQIAITFSVRTRKKFPGSACNTTCGARSRWIAGNGPASPLGNASSMSAQD